MGSPCVASSVTVSLTMSSPPFLISMTWSTFTSEGFDVSAAFACGEKASVNNGSMNRTRRTIVSLVLFKLNTPFHCVIGFLCLLCRIYYTLSLFTFLIRKPSTRAQIVKYLTMATFYGLFPPRAHLSTRPPSGQVTKYKDRFQSLRALHERLLSDFIISDLNNEQAYETAKQFFGSSTIRFARASYLTPNRGLYHNCTRKTKTKRPHTSQRKIYLEQTK